MCCLSSNEQNVFGFFAFLTTFKISALPVCGHSRLHAIFERCSSNAERDT